MIHPSEISKPFLSVFDRQVPPAGPPPIWLMRQAGRYLPEYRAVRQQVGTFLDLCYTPELAAEVTLQPIRRFGFDAAIIFADILLVADALGCDVRFEEGVGPLVSPVRSRQDVVALTPEATEEHLTTVCETIRQVSTTLEGTSVSLIGFAGAPWTVATYMVGGGKSANQEMARSWASESPDEFGGLIDVLTEVTVSYLKMQVVAGAEALQLFDSWAGGLSADMFNRWCVRPVAEIVSRLRADWPSLPIMGFPRGCGLLYQTCLQETGLSGLAVDPEMSPVWCRDHLQPDGVVHGNLDPAILKAGGLPMREATENILDALSGGPFIFGLGHGVLPETPVAHVAELIAQVRAHGK